MKKVLIPLLLFIDFLFTTSLEVIRQYTGLFSGYELSFNFTYGFSENVYVHLIASLLTITASLIADNIAGKIFTTIFGLFFAITSFVFCLLESFVEIPFSVVLSSVFFSVYLGCSQARNLLMLEQLDNLKLNIFLIVYLRLIGRGLFHWFNPKHYILTIVSLSFSVIYLILIIIFAKNFHIEPVYLNVFFKIQKCIVNAYKNRRRKERGASHYDIRHKKSIEELVIKEPLPDKSFPYYKAIFQEKEEQKSIAPSIFEPPPKDEEWTVLGYISSFFPLGTTTTPAPEPSSRATSKILTEKETPKSDGREQHVINSENLGHWLFRAYPKSTYYIIFQGIRLQNSLLFIYLGFLYTFLSTFITLSSIFLQTVALDFEIDVISFSVMFELILFPIVEFYLCPAISDYYNNKMGPFGVGHFCLIISGTLVLIVHLVLVLTLPYIPEKDSVQIRIHNLLDSQAVIYTKLTEYKDINSKEFLGIYDIHEKGSVPITVRYQINGFPIEKISTLELGNVSYIITERGFFWTRKKDPTIFTEKEKTIVFVLGENKNAELTFKYHEDDNKEIQVASNDAIEIEDGIYNVAGYSYKFEKGSMHAILVGKASEVIGIIMVEGPISISFEHILGFVFFKSVANSFATVAFFRTAFYEAPEKMRTIVFGFLYAGNFLASALIEYNFHYFAVHTSLLLIFMCCHIIFFTIGVFTAYKPIAL